MYNNERNRLLKKKENKQLAFNYWWFEAPPPSFALFHRCRSSSAEVSSSEETLVTAHISASTLVTLSVRFPAVFPHSFSSNLRYFVEQTTFFSLFLLFNRLSLPCGLAVSEGFWRGWRLSRRFSSGARIRARDTEMWPSATWAPLSEMDWPSALSSTSSDRTSCKSRLFLNCHGLGYRSCPRLFLLFCFFA